MKTIITILVPIFLLCFFTEGCKKDKNKDETTTNFLKVGSSRSDLSQGIILEAPLDDTLNYMVLELFSSGITIHEYSEWPNSLTGNGNMVAFNLYTTALDKFPLGEYTVASPADTFHNGTLIYPEYILDWNINLDPEPAFAFTTSGTLKVIQNGPEYEISFNGKDMTGNAVSCYYKGSIRFSSYYGDKKTAKINDSGNSIKSLMNDNN
jgi:hypothetical protein